MHDKAVSEDPIMLKYCLNRHKTQKVWDKAVDDFLPAFVFVPDRFVTSKMIKKLHNALFTDGEILFLDEDSGNVTFLVIKWIFLV